MTSHMLANLITAAKEVQARGWDGCFRSRRFLSHLAGLGKMDAARRLFYSHDEASLAVFDWCVQYTALQSFFGVPLPCELENTPFPAERWRELERRAEAMTEGFAEGDYLLDRIDTWLLQCYSLPGFCDVLPGDVVLDCGTYTGNTTLYFSQRTGTDGHVYGFEASGGTFARYKANVEHLSNCTPVRCAVTGKSGVVCFGAGGPGASISAEGEQVPAVSLDDFAAQQSLTRVDFIKMDIEGAEGEALQGAAGIIRRFRPRMALSGYHRAYDLSDLPAIVRGIDPNYSFQLGHYSNREWETVIFCAPGDNAAAVDSAPETGPETGPAALRNFLAFLAEVQTASIKDCDAAAAKRMNEAYNELLARVNGAYNELLEQYADAERSVSAATGIVEQLAEENKRLTAENAAMRRAVERAAAPGSGLRH